MCSREDIFKERVQFILKRMEQQFPSLFFRADFWRQQTLDAGEDTYPDRNPMVWVRLSENIPVFVFEKNERFFQADIGVVNYRAKYMIVPEYLDLLAGDHATFFGGSYFISERASQGGVAKLKIEEQKSNFKAPSRTLPVQRILGVKVSIA